MNKTILVTGGAGHVGSHVIEELVADKQNHVISLDNYFNGSEKNHIPGAEYRRGHTKDIHTLIPETPDILYHLGEYARIAPSIKEVAQVFDMNVVGTFAWRNSAATEGPKLVYAASSTNSLSKGQAPESLRIHKAVNVDLFSDYGRWYICPWHLLLLQRLWRVSVETANTRRHCKVRQAYLKNSH
jgi:UDP-glucose 4-epimerase